MSLFSETYSEYNANCDKCHKEVLEVIEYMDVKEWDDGCGVCSKCRKVFCKRCVVEKGDKIYCPECDSELMEFWGASVYDLINVLSHDCQPFERKK